MKKLIGLMMLMAVTTAFADGDKGHGGDMVVSEFTGTARNVADAFMGNEDIKACPSREELLKAIEDTKVFSSFVVYKEESLRDAWNDRSKMTIELSRSNLYNISDSLNYVTLALHEYMGILGYEGTNNFNRSHNCLNALIARKVNVEGLRYRVKPLNGVIEKLSKGEMSLRCNGNVDFDFKKNNYITSSFIKKFWKISLKNWKVDYDLNTGNTEVYATTMFQSGNIQFDDCLRDLRQNEDRAKCYANEFKFSQLASGEFKVDYLFNYYTKPKPVRTVYCTPYIVQSYGR